MPIYITSIINALITKSKLHTIIPIVWTDVNILIDINSEPLKSP